MDKINFIYATIGVIGTVAAFVFGYAALKRNTKADNRNEGERGGALMTEIGYIKSGIDDIKHKQEVTDERYLNTAERLASVESSVKQAHHRIDTIEGKIGE